MSRFECHSHTMYSNLRLLDCINQPRALVDRAIEIGLTGIAITDHESLSSFVELDKIQQELIEQGSSFKIARGDEIYLTDTRDKNQKYWHFILIAKDAIGCKALRELSSIAWINSYFDRGLERVPTLKTDLENIITKYGKGHLIMSTACLGSELDHWILEMDKAEQEGRIADRRFCYNQIVDFIQWCNSLAGDDFYLEVQPAQSKEQLTVNRWMKKIAKAMNKKIIVPFTYETPSFNIFEIEIGKTFPKKSLLSCSDSYNSFRSKSSTFRTNFISSLFKIILLNSSKFSLFTK